MNSFASSPGRDNFRSRSQRIWCRTQKDASVINGRWRGRADRTINMKVGEKPPLTAFPNETHIHWTEDGKLASGVLGTTNRLHEQWAGHSWNPQACIDNTERDKIEYVQTHGFSTCRRHTDVRHFSRLIQSIHASSEARRHWTTWLRIAQILMLWYLHWSTQRLTCPDVRRPRRGNGFGGANGQGVGFLQNHSLFQFWTMVASRSSPSSSLEQGPGTRCTWHYSQLE